MVVKGVGVAELKARLSEHLRLVKKGRTVTVSDRDTPIAQLVPVETGQIEIRRATRRAQSLPRPPAAVASTDRLAALLADRACR